MHTKEREAEREELGDEKKYKKRGNETTPFATKERRKSEIFTDS